MCFDSMLYLPFRHLLLIGGYTYTWWCSICRWTIAVTKSSFEVSTLKSKPQNNFHNQLVWKLQTKEVNNNKQMSVEEGIPAMIIYDSWRFTNASISLSRVAQLDSHSQCFFACQAICTFFAYPCRVVWMIDATSSSFSIHLWISHGMFPHTPNGDAQHL
jgi:hypothetical protein